MTGARPGAHDLLTLAVSTGANDEVRVDDALSAARNLRGGSNDPSHHSRRPAPGRAPRHQGGDLRQERHWQDLAAVDAEPPDTTLFFDLEAGDLAIEGWTGDTIRPRTWQECRDFAVFIGGPNPAIPDEQPYSQAHYDAVCAKFGDPRPSTSTPRSSSTRSPSPGRLCFQWCKGAARGLLGEDRQAGYPRRLRPAWPRDDRLAHPSPAHARQERRSSSASSTRSSMTSTARSTCRRSTARRPVSSFPGIVDEVLTLTEIAETEATGQSSPRLRLPDAQPLGLSRQGSLGSPRHDRGSPPRPPDRQDRRPRRSPLERLIFAARRQRLRMLLPSPPSQHSDPGELP